MVTQLIAVSTPGAQTIGGYDRVASAVSMAALVCLQLDLRYLWTARIKTLHKALIVNSLMF